MWSTDRRSLPFPKFPGAALNEIEEKATAALRGEILSALEDNLCGSQTVLQGLWTLG